MTLDYFYGQAGELFSFFRIPKALFQEQQFQDLSTDAKTLYGILLDRMSLSVKNESLFIAELYPETLTVLKKLSQKGYHMAVATNKSHENAMAILEHFGVAKYCDFAMGSDLEGKLKKADIIKKCLEVLYVNPNEAIYIGDSIFDLEGAQKMGMDFIGVTYGFGFHRGESIGYRLVNSMHEIGEIF